MLIQINVSNGIPTVMFFGTIGIAALAVFAIILLVHQYYTGKTQRLLFKTKLQIREQTFNMISEEIHDNIGQMLSLAKVQLAILENSVGKGTSQVEQLKETLQTVSSELRQMARGLSGDHVKSFTIIELVSNLAARINECNVTSVELTTTGERRALPEREKFIVFRIIQESLQNCLKHACAKHIQIEFQFNTNGLNVYIEDDGKGFDINEELLRSGGLGLQHIRERMKLIGGNAGISSQPSAGTRVLLQLPLHLS